MAMNKQRRSSNIANIFSYDDAGNIVIKDYGQVTRYSWNGLIHGFVGPVSVSSVSAATTDTDRFLVSDGGVLKYRTGVELLSDIGGVPSTRTLTINGVTQDLSVNRTFTIAAGISGSGADGQVAYWNGTNSQTGSNNLFWDAANSRLGIGIAAPTRPLSITFNANDGNGLLYLNNPNTGSAANAGLVVQATTASGSVFATSSTYSTYGILTANMVGFYASSTFGIAVQSGDFIIGTANELFPKFRLFGNTGNVLIQNGGTFTDAGFRLDVNGTARGSGNTTFGTIGAGTGMFWDSTNNNLGIGTNAGSATDSISIIGSSSQRKSIVVQNTNSAGNTSLYFQNNRGSFASYGGLLHGGATYATTFFGISSADKTVLLSDGANSTGLMIGTLVSANLIFGTNNAERARITAAGRLLLGTITEGTDLLLVNGSAKIVGNFNAIGLAKFETSAFPDYSTYIGDGTYANGIGFCYGLNASGEGAINLAGYLGGITQFRDLRIGNGKGADIAKFFASTGNLVLQNGGTLTDVASAQLQVSSTTKGFLQPRMTTTQRDAIASPATGLSVYNTTTNTSDFYNGTTWTSAGNVMGSGATGQVAYWNGTNSQTGSAGLVYNDSTGLMTLSKNQNNPTRLAVTNTTSGTTSAAQVALTSDSLSGLFAFGKFSTGSLAYKTLSAKDAYIFNESFGDISLLNDFATGKIKFAAGGAITPQMTLTAAGRLLLGTTTEGTNILEANGSARISGKITANGSTTSSSGLEVGSMNFQYFAINNAFIAENAYYNGSAFQRINTGFVSSFYFTAGGFMVGTMPSGSAGTTQANLNQRMYLTNAGTLAVSDTISGGGNITLVASAVLQADSTTRGFLPPRMTTTEKNAIATPAAGLVVYDSTTNVPNYYDGTSWVAMGGGGGASIYTADGTLTSNRTVSSGGFSLVFNPQTAFVTTLSAATNDSTTALVSQNTLSYASGFSSTNIGSVYGAVAGINLQTFAGSATFEQANLATAAASVNSIDFSATGATITMLQPVSSGIRAMTGHQSQIQYQGANSGTITHSAVSQNLGFYRPSAATGTLTITNAYSLLLNDLNDYGGTGFVFTNRWGIYQDGASDNNYFKGKVVIGSTDTVGASPLNVKNLPTSATGLATGDIWNNGGVLNVV